MSMEVLKNDIKKGALNAVYLFFGPEEYLIGYYLKELERMLVDPMFKSFNYCVLEGKEHTMSIINICDTLPVMSEKKLIVIRESGLFGSESKGKKGKHDSDEIDALIGYLANVPKGIHLVFVEQNVNKRSKMYNAVKDRGVCVEFKHPQEEELVKWITKVLNSERVRIGKSEAIYLANLCNPGMIEVLNEVRKLIDYVGQDKEVTKEHIDSICIKSLQSKVFDMIDSITLRKPEKAYELLNDMIILKEPLQKINVLVARHFKLLYYVKQMKTKGLAAEKIAGYLNVQPFIAGKYVRQSGNYTSEKLKQAIRSSLEMDIRIKTGKADPRIALETLIAEYSI